ncbi:MAG: DNA polymerase Y family protein [Pseudomonadota bacterium]
MQEHTDAQHQQAKKKLYCEKISDTEITKKKLNPNVSNDVSKHYAKASKRDAARKDIARKNIEIMSASKRALVAKTLSKPLASAPAKLWLHIHLPQLPLDILTRGGDELRPCVLCEARANRRHILLANSAAIRLGVRQGMPLNAAHILGDLNVFEPDPQLEKKALRQICHWALQFSPVISEVDNDGVLIEIKGSLKLFNGIDRLLAEVKKGLKELGYKFSIAVAPTPLGATALARSGNGQVVQTMEAMTTAVSRLPVSVLRLPSKQTQILDSIGVRVIGDCTRLPRGGVGRRTSPDLVKAFDRLAGNHPDPRPPFEPSKIFQSQVELPWETRKVQTLMIAGERLLQELTGYLRGISGLANTLRWTLYHTDNTSTHFQLELVKPSRDAAYFAMLFREKIARCDIHKDVKEVSLYVDQLSKEQILSHADLFEQNPALGAGNHEDWHAFVDRLRTRLGDKAVKGLKAIADHRPECAWRWQQPSFLTAAKAIKRKLPTKQLSESQRAYEAAGDGLPHQNASMPQRPVWLM